MSYRIELTSKAQRQLAKLDRKTLLLVSDFIENKLGASDDPCRLPCAKKLQGIENGWRWRIGAYRVLGTVDNGEVTIVLFRIGNRRDVYRNLQSPS